MTPLPNSKSEVSALERLVAEFEGFCDYDAEIDAPLVKNARAEHAAMVAALKDLKYEYDDRKNQFGYDHPAFSDGHRLENYLWHKYEDESVIARVDALLTQNGRHE